MTTLQNLLKSFPDQGDRTAIIYRTGVRRFVFSYAWLYDQARRCAALLEQQGVRSGDRVLLWAPNSPWWAVAFWGIVARGAVAVPADFSAGRERTQDIASLSGAVFAFQSRLKADQLNRPKSIMIEDLEGTLAETTPGDMAGVGADDLAELIYTSGTTGQPKGVALTHGNLIANIRQVNAHIRLRPDYVFLSALPLSHMFEQMGGFFSPLYRGGAIVYLRTIKPSAIIAAMAQERVSVMMLVPRLLQALRNGLEREMTVHHLDKVLKFLLSLTQNWPRPLRRLVFAPIRRRLGPAIAFFVSGGAALDPELAKFWQGLGYVVVEGYGLTECSPILAANTPERQVPGSVGWALPGVELKTQDGELWARGRNVFTGYHDNEAATKEAFTADGWLKTGDLASVRADGAVFLKGRRKELIVTGAGLNVYPDEIESALIKVAGVKEACVIGLDRGQGEEVHAVLVLDGSGRVPADIIAETNVRLDALQQITGFSVWQGELPKTPTLKVRKFMVAEELKAGKINRAEDKDRLRELIARATGRPSEEIREDSRLTADLSLTSIARLELANALEQEFRLDLDDSAIAQTATVSDLRLLISQRRNPRATYRPRRWLNAGWIRAVRRAADIIWTPLFARLARLEVRGRENLEKSTGPVLFVSNHTSYIDGLAIWFALPPRWRYRYATAAGDEFFFYPGGGWARKLTRRLMYEVLAFFGNAFILPEQAGFKQAMQHMGELIDRGVSVLYFPEGGLQRPGQILPYKLGVGLIVQELKIPVVPIKLAGLAEIIAPDTAQLRSGRATVSFGAPMNFSDKQPSEVVDKIKQAIESL